MKISGKNISEFSAYLQGDYLHLVAFPSLKEVKKNDWAEHNGIEYDTSDIALKERYFNLEFFFKDKNQYQNFVDYIFENTYQTWEFENIELSLYLRSVKAFDYKEFENFCQCKINVSDDFPLRNYSYEMPSIDNPTTDFFLNEIDFSKYGIIPLFENKNSLSQTFEIKEHLKIDSLGNNGVKYAEHVQFFKEDVIELYCFMNLPIADFWKHYNAFLYDLTRRQYQNLTTFGKQRKVIYQKSDVKHFSVEKENVRAEFVISLIDTRQ